MRVLAITQIWPNSKEPLSCLFNLQQFKALGALCNLTVLAAIPYFPAASHTGQPPRPALLDALPARERIEGVDTVYLRQLYVPRFGVPIAVPLYLASMRPHRDLLRSADVVLGTWAYPDGCASSIVSRALRKPCAVKVHGSDLNLVGKMPSARAVLRRVLPKADALVSVARALSDELAALGVPRDRIHLVPNGVDTKLFAPHDKGEARRALGVPDGRPLALFVGRLEPQKGLGELLEAWDRVRAARPDAMLALVGDGVWKDRVDAKRGSLDGSIFAPGARPLREVAQWLAACDVFTLPSWMEGTPNVVLEALASGRPAVATRVGGIPDILADPESGVLVAPRDAAALADGLLAAFGRSWEPLRVRACGPGSWEESAARLYAILAALHEQKRRTLS
jgi:glycosyltransferase involved in cell wall biosynthesis